MVDSSSLLLRRDGRLRRWLEHRLETAGPGNLISERHPGQEVHPSRVEHHQNVVHVKKRADLRSPTYLPAPCSGAGWTGGSRRWRWPGARRPERRVRPALQFKRSVTLGEILYAAGRVKGITFMDVMQWMHTNAVHSPMQCTKPKVQMQGSAPRYSMAQ